jgi:hypothetical protein
MYSGYSFSGYVCESRYQRDSPLSPSWCARCALRRGQMMRKWYESRLREAEQGGPGEEDSASTQAALDVALAAQLKAEQRCDRLQARLRALEAALVAAGGTGAQAAADAAEAGRQRTQAEKATKGAIRRLEEEAVQATTRVQTEVAASAGLLAEAAAQAEKAAAQAAAQEESAKHMRQGPLPRCSPPAGPAGPYCVISDWCACRSWLCGISGVVSRARAEFSLGNRYLK